MKRYRDRWIVLIAAVAAFVSLVPAALAQIAPTPETTFTNSADTAWGTAGNWNNGLPTAGSSPSNALIQAGLTVDASTVAFDTLTIGVGSRLNLNTTFPSGKDVYFSDGSYLDMNGGNDPADWFILPGANATNTVGNDRIPGATLQGAGNLAAIVEGNIFWRKDCSGLTGTLTFLSNSGTSTRSVSMDSVMAPSTNILGPRINGFMGNHNRMPDSSTLKLVGGTQSGSSAVKFRLEFKDGQDYSDTIANLIVESPVGLTGTEPLIMATDGGNKLTVTDTVTFQGTADAVEIADKTPASTALVTSNMTFTGTGSWTMQGVGGIELTGGTISNDVDATISNTLTAASGFTKAGAGTLTLGDPSGLSGGIIINEGAIVCTTNVTFSSGDYVSVIEIGTSFAAEYGGTFTNIADVNAGIGLTGYFRPTASAFDQGSSFRVEPPAAGTVLIIK